MNTSIEILEALSGREFHHHRRNVIGPLSIEILFAEES
jgi:hypothetical protein